MSFRTVSKLIRGVCRSWDVASQSNRVHDRQASQMRFKRGIEMKKTFIARVSFYKKDGSFSGGDYRNFVLNDNQTFSDLRKWIEQIENSRGFEAGSIDLIYGEYPEE